MSRTSDLQTALEAIIEPVCRAHEVELVEVRLLTQRGDAVLRVTIDRPRDDVAEVPGSGVSLDDCTDVSRDISTELDGHEELIPGHYRLEVSSPGLERPLVKPRDFERFAGREVRVETKAKLDDRRRFQGALRGVVDDTIELDQDGRAIRIPFAAIVRAHLIHRF